MVKVEGNSEEARDVEAPWARAGVARAREAVKGSGEGGSSPGIVITDSLIHQRLHVCLIVRQHRLE